MAYPRGYELAHYEIIESLGEGGMGVVYRARDRKLKRDVAIKVLSPELVANEREKQRLVEEAQAAAALKHPGIAVIYEVDDCDETTFIAMELVEGRTLEDYVEGERPGVSRKLELCVEIASALSRAHAHGIVHRDLKPANIMVTEDGHAKIIDFGLAKHVVPEAGVSSETPTVARAETREGSIVGTLSYMSPEQLRGKSVDQRTDIFSFGVVLYEVLTGQLPFRAPSPVELPHAIIHEDPPPLEGVEGATGLAPIVRRCLAKSSSDRYHSAKELEADLRRAATSATTVELRRKGSRLLPWFAGAAGLALVVTVAIVATRSTVGLSDVPLPRVDRTIQLTRDPGLEVDPALSPDGRFVAYAKGPVGATKIFVQQIAGGRAVALTEDVPGAHFRPSWSPDGSEVAFTVSVEGRLSTYAVPALGGAARRVLEEGLAAVWSPDGDALAYFKGGPLQVTEGLWVLARDEEPVLAVSGRDLGVASWSPDGKRLAYAAGNFAFFLRETQIANLAPSSLWVVAADYRHGGPGDPVRLTEDRFLDQNPIWTPDGEHLLFVSDRGGGRDIYRLSLNGAGAPERMTTGLDVHSFSASLDGTRIAYAVLTTRQNVWSLPIPETGAVSVGEATSVTTGNQIVEGMHVSSDGEWIAFDSNRGGNSDIYKMPIGGGEPVPLTSHPADDFVPAWSWDGRYIAFHSLRTGNRDIFVISAEGGPVRRVTTNPDVDLYPDWSPDGRRIVFQTRRGGTMRVYVVEVEDGEPVSEPVPLTSGEAWTPKWSPDGAWVAFSNGTDLAVASADGRQVEILVAGTGVTTPAWSEDSRTVYYKHQGENGNAIWAVSVTGGSPRVLVLFDVPERTPQRGEWAVRNGRFYFTAPEHESDIWLMELDR